MHGRLRLDHVPLVSQRALDCRSATDSDILTALQGTLDRYDRNVMQGNSCKPARANSVPVPLIFSVFFGLGTISIFGGVLSVVPGRVDGLALAYNRCSTFLVESYPLWAASALAANSFARSTFGAGFPYVFRRESS